MRRTGPSALQHPHGRHNERPRRVGRVIEDHRSPSGRITPDIRVIIADFFGQICGDDHLYITRSVATEDSACDRRAPLARWRVPPVASGQPCRSARRSCRGQAGAPPAAWHALGAAAAHPQRRQVAPRRAVSAPCHRAGAPGAPVLRHRRSPPAGRTAARRKQSWPDPLRRRQESPAKRHHATAPVQGSKRWERNVLPGQGILGPSWHTPSASHASNSALCRDQITADRQAHRAAALLYFAAVQGS